MKKHFVLPTRVNPVSIAALVALMCLAGCGQGPKQALRFDLQSGQTYELSIRTSSDTEVANLDGKPVKLRVAKEFTFNLLPGESEPDGSTIIKVEPKMAHFGVVFDRVSKAFLSYSFQIHVLPSGKIEQFSGTDVIRTAALHALEQHPNSAMPADYVIQKTVSDETLRGLIEPVISVWPTVPVASGDKWTRATIYDPNTDTSETAEFHVESLENGQAVLSMQAKATPAGRDPGRNMSGITTGQMTISATDGTIKAYRSTQTLSGELRDPANSSMISAKETTETQAELTAR